MKNTGSFERREHQLLLLAARHRADLSSRTAIDELLSRDPDWEYLLKLADRHGLLPHLGRQIHSQNPTAPARVIETLRSKNHQISRSNLALTGELIKTLDVFNRNGIEAATFKGPALAILGYGDVGMRQFLDLDILVRKRDVVRVRDLLAETDFRLEPQISPAQETAWLKFDCAGTFVNESGLLLDVHWDFAPRYFSFDSGVDAFWSRLRPLMIAGRKVMTLCPEDLLQVLCFHSFTHAWERLGWIADISALIERTPNFDWNAVARRAAKSGSMRILALGLLLAHNLLKMPVPREFEATIKANSKLRTVAENIKAQLFAHEPVAKSVLKETAAHIAMRERTRDKLKTVTRMTITPRRYDWELIRSPMAPVFSSYLMRPLRMAARIGTSRRNGHAHSPATINQLTIGEADKS